VQNKTGLQKQTQQRLLIRLAMKIGYLAEFRDDAHAALKYYTEAHASTSEWRAALAARVRSNFSIDLPQLETTVNAPPPQSPLLSAISSTSSTSTTSWLSEVVAIEALRDDEAAALATLAWYLSTRCHLGARRPDLAAQLTRREAAAVRYARACVRLMLSMCA
jgi:hypothetical protein